MKHKQIAEEIASIVSNSIAGNIALQIDFLGVTFHNVYTGAKTYRSREYLEYREPEEIAADIAEELQEAAERSAGA